MYTLPPLAGNVFPAFFNPLEKQQCWCEDKKGREIAGTRRDGAAYEESE